MHAEIKEKVHVCLLNGYGIGVGCCLTPYAPAARRAGLAIDGEVRGGANMNATGPSIRLPAR